MSASDKNNLRKGECVLGHREKTLRKQLICRVPRALRKARNTPAKVLPSATVGIVHSTSILKANNSLPNVFCQALGKDVPSVHRLSA